MFLNFKNFLKKNIEQTRYIISGCFFTIFAPVLFLFISNYLPSKLSFIISDSIIQVLRFNSLTIWVFKSRINKSSLKAYLKASIPLSLINLILVSTLSPIINRINVAILIGMFSASAGFLWSKFCYRKIKKK